MERERILAILRQHEPELKAAGLLHLRLFGSVARGDNTPESDIDLIADFDRSRPLTLLTLAQHQYRLTDMLGREVDLSSAEWMFRQVREHALKEDPRCLLIRKTLENSLLGRQSSIVKARLALQNLQHLHITGISPLNDMRADDRRTKQLASMLTISVPVNYLHTQKWCIGMGDVYFGVGLGSVFSVFLVEIDPQPTGVDRWLWVIVGDIPSAYLVTDESPNPIAAAETYIGLMRSWIGMAREGESSSTTFPVNLPTTPESANRLERKIDSLQQHILPWLQQVPPLQ